VQESALAVGISGLITTVIPGLRRLRDKMIDQGLGHVKLMAGGAALKQASAESLNVDYVAQTSFDGLHYLEQLTGEKR
jgi:methanogenic corrinoid protein MtbC1